jgi:predicted DNA-binding protein
MAPARVLFFLTSFLYQAKDKKKNIKKTTLFFRKPGFTMKEERDSKTMTVRVPLTLTAEIERIAKKRKVTSAHVVRMCLELGVDCHKDMEKLGLIGVVDFSYYVTKSLRDSLASIKGKQLSLL